MNSAGETAHYAWHVLRDTLAETCDHWSDSTTEYFLAYYWQPLEDETERFLAALDNLTAVLQSALYETY